MLAGLDDTSTGRAHAEELLTTATVRFFEAPGALACDFSRAPPTGPAGSQRPPRPGKVDPRLADGNAGGMVRGLTPSWA
jgi:hypothetical protein